MQSLGDVLYSSELTEFSSTIVGLVINILLKQLTTDE